MRNRLHNLRYATALLILLIGGGLSWGAFQLARRGEQAADRAALKVQAADLGRDLDRELTDALNVLEIVGNLAAADADLDAARFRDLVTPFLARNPIFATLEWIVQVPIEARRDFEVARRAEGLADFTIREANGRERTGSRKHLYYYPVKYVEPRARYGQVAGFDRRRYRAMFTARSTGQVTATRDQTRLHGEDGSAGFAIFYPVYVARRRLETSQERQDAWRGSLCATVHYAELVRQANLRREAGRGLWLQINEVASSGEHRRAFEGEAFSSRQGAPVASGAAPPPAEGLFAGRLTRFAGRNWWIAFSPAAEPATTATWRSIATLLGGFFLSLALAGWWLSAASRGYRTEQLVAQRTEELSAANRALADEIGQRTAAQIELRAEQVFLKHLLGSHERDRQLMAFEIHDGMVQYSIAALMYLEGFVSGQPADTQPPAKVLRAIELVRRSIAEARHVMNGLRPPVLDDLGVVAAIQSLIDEQPAAQERCRFVHDVSFGRLNPLLEGTIYRIVQESLANIVRHSQAPRAQVSLKQRGDRLELEVQDWGVGFDTGRLDGRGFGLRGLAERARLFDAELKIESAPNRGARVFVELPVIFAASSERIADHVGSGSV